MVRAHGASAGPPATGRTGPVLALVLAALLLPFLFGAADAEAQYFGRNKVQYRAFDFQILRTENFDVYYYPQEREAALDAARMIERSYARLSRVLQHEFRERKPLIIYASHTDFQQTNALSGFLDESTGGVTESFKRRMILPFTGSYADFDHVLTHELVHGFQYDVLLGGGVTGEASPFTVRLPLWFMEGMAEYLSIGRIDAHTVSWLRDAVLNGYLRSIDEMTQRDDYLSYRFGQSLWAYIGSKWGDEVVGILLQKAPRVGLPRAFASTLGITLDELNAEWHASVRSTYLAQVTEHQTADRFATRLTDHVELYDPWFLAPSISPDGRQMIYLSQRDSYSFDLWLADAHTGEVRKRLVSSARSAGLESLRFMYSGTAFSHDGNYVAFVAKDGGQDALNVYDLRRDRIIHRLRFDLNGITSPSWSPDGGRIVFTGLDGGLSDLFITDLDGRLTRLTQDRYADLLPSWSPDGRTIAFTTDRQGTELDVLRYGNMRTALIDIGTRRIEVLPYQEEGKNINPVWSPDGAQLVWVSDREGTNDLYLYDVASAELSRISNLLSGAIAVSALSPVLSWSRSGRLLFTYFENAGYNTYALEDPRQVARVKVGDGDGSAAASASAEGTGSPAAGGSAAAAASTAATASVAAASVTGAEVEAAAADSGRASAAASYYRAADGTFRPSAELVAGSQAEGPVSVMALLDSAALALPDTASFEHREYAARLTTDMVGQPNVGTQVGGHYGNGVYGGSYLAMSDMLGNHNLQVSGSVNGSLSDASFISGYSYLKHRVNLHTGVWHVPLYRYGGAGYFPMEVKGQESLVAGHVYLRDVIRGGQLGLSYPFSTFRRLELGATAIGYQSTMLLRGHDVTTNEPVEVDRRSDAYSYVQPEVALVFDNSMTGWTGPVTGRRYRLQLSRALGDFDFTEGLVDFRNYSNPVRGLILATRLTALARHGAGTEQFALFWGGPYYIRGYDFNSFDVTGSECARSREAAGGRSLSRCPVRDQLIGSSAAFFNAEVRYPVVRELQIGFLGSFPPVDGVAFFDGGIAWDQQVCSRYDYLRRERCVTGRAQAVRVSRERQAGDDPLLVRVPVYSYGVGLRLNVFFAVLRIDYAWPLNRPDRGGMLSFSFGQSF